MKDYYQILDVHPDASLEIMNNAYRTLVRQYHPDLYHTRHKERVTTRMQEINEAYQTLSNPTKRALYDQAFRQWRTTQPAPRPELSAKNWTFRLRRLVLWTLGTYILLKLLMPLMATPLGKGLFLVLSLYFILRWRMRRRLQS